MVLGWEDQQCDRNERSADVDLGVASTRAEERGAEGREKESKDKRKQQIYTYIHIYMSIPVSYNLDMRRRNRSKWC